MEFTIMKLKDIPFTILDKYKKEFILPINAEVNSAIYIKPTATDTNTQIHDMTKLIGMTSIALVILDVDHLFIKEEGEWTVYGNYIPAMNIVLCKEGRRIIKTFRDYLTEVNMFREIIHTPETLVFGMCHSGLIL
jgi:hypothetical protein